MKTFSAMGEEPWVKDVRTFLSRATGVLLRLRGLPYECSAAQVVEFFRRGDHPCEIIDSEDGVYFVRKPDGKSTGDAFVMFGSEAEAHAALTKHKQSIGARYIELFRLSVNEMEQAVRRTLEAKSRPAGARMQQQLHQQPASAALPCGTVKDCIRLRGLPYEAQVHHILEFLGPLAKNIVLQGVHMVFSSLGQPTGEVFVQLDSEASASRAASQCNNGLMAFGKKHRYIEVVQCSGQDMVSFPTETPLPNPAMMNEMMAAYMPMFPPPVLEPRLPPPLQPSSPLSPAPFVYVVLANHQDPLYVSPPMPEWIPDYSMAAHMSIQQPDYFVS